MLTSWVLLIKASGLDGVDFSERAILNHLLRSTIRIVIYVRVSINSLQSKHRKPSICQEHSHRRQKGTRNLR